MIRLIIFDLGGVITTPEVEKYDEYLAEKFKIGLKDFKIITSKYKTDVTKGKIGLKDVYENLVKGLKLDLDANSIMQEHIKRTYDIFSRLNKTNLSIIERLKKRYMVIALANAEKEIIPIGTKMGLYSPFQKAYISCQMGMQKPDSEIYMKVLSDLKCRPEEAIFIDDKIENVEGARALGMRAIQFTQGTDLEKELRRYIIF